MDAKSNAESRPGMIPRPSWFRENASSLITTIIGVALVCWLLNPLDVLLVIIGLGGIVFVHELGHFLAAKACNVHVKTFSIGFGPPLPFCSFQWGETYYKLALIPLGGYVAMVGQSEEGETTEEKAAAEDDPRSYRNKSVFQRMVIISAGVMMNIILAVICFIAAYMNGVEEQPAIASSVDPGSAAWRAGLRPGDHLTKLDELDNPWFDDIRPAVSTTQEGEHVHIETKAGQVYDIEPLRAEGALFPQLGIAPPSSTTLFHSRRDKNPPFERGSTASLAKAADGRGFEPGDKIVAMSDPTQPDRLTPLDHARAGFATDHLEFQSRLQKLAGRPVTVEVERRGGQEKALIVIPAAFRKETGAIMQMGPVVALRAGSSAEKGGVQIRKMAGDKILEPGDVITVVELPEADGGCTVISADSKEPPKGPSARIKLLDPLKLPLEFNQWAERQTASPAASRTVKLTVSRVVDHTPKPVTLELTWDDSYREYFAGLSNPGSPVPLGGLGLAYQVIGNVSHVLPGSPAAAAGLLAGDKVKKVKFFTLDKDNSEKPLGDFEDIKEHHWAFADHRLQLQAPHKIEMKLDRGGQEVTVVVTGTANPKDPWPVPAEGFVFTKLTQRQTAGSVGEALEMGFRRTVRAIKGTYLGLYSMIFGRISVKMISGPITLARASYILAGEDTWKLVLLVALISINLAVVNFLPIPVLDGGHMVFLLYEWIARRPPPALLHWILTLCGLAIVLLMMVFAVGLDVVRLFR